MQMGFAANGWTFIAARNITNFGVENMTDPNFCNLLKVSLIMLELLIQQNASSFFSCGGRHYDRMSTSV